MRIALVENFGADFVGARLRYALFLKENGIEVTAIIPQDGCRDVIVGKGIRVIEVGGNIRGNGVANKINYAIKLKSILQEESFDIVHFYRLQPNIIGTFIAGLFTNSKIVNHVTGLGVAFSNKSFKNIFFQFLIKKMYRINNYFFSPYTIYQNKQDAFDLGIHKNSIVIEGSAVNETKFDKKILETKKNEIQKIREEIGIIQENAKVFLFVSRLLKEKGILELIEGFIKVQDKLERPIYLLIVGWSDVENPSSITINELEMLTKDFNNIKLLGKRSDVELLLALSDVSILPTYYREGTPRFLLESMSMGKAIITTNMPGCDHLVLNEKNGLLIQTKSVTAIKEAITTILEKDLRVLGEESNKLYFNKFSEHIVYNSILNLYINILK